jgi:hypothetical protein
MFGYRDRRLARASIVCFTIAFVVIFIWLFQGCRVQPSPFLDALPTPEYVGGKCRHRADYAATVWRDRTGHEVRVVFGLRKNSKTGERGRHAQAQYRADDRHRWRWLQFFSDASVGPGPIDSDFIPNKRKSGALEAIPLNEYRNHVTRWAEEHANKRRPAE